MSFDWLTIVLAIVGGGGTLGLIALFFAAPAIFTTVIEAAQSILTAVVATRLGCAALAALAGGIVADQYRVHIDGAAYTKGIRDEKAKWDAAEAAAAKRGADARQEAEAEVPPLPSLPALPAEPPAHGVSGAVQHILHPRRVRGDPFDRDNH